MKKKFWSFLFVVLSLGLFCNCSNEDNSIVGDDGGFVELEFIADLNSNLLTRAGGTETDCMTLEELIEYHQEEGNELRAKIGIKFSDRDTTDIEDVVLRIIEDQTPPFNDANKDEDDYVLSNKRLITDIISLDFANGRTYTLKYMYI